MSKGAKDKRAKVRQMHPIYPDVRCSNCNIVYRIQLPYGSGLAILTGSCPKCGSERFDTVINANAEITET